jgi:hypothetical protein
MLIDCWARHLPCKDDLTPETASEIYLRSDAECYLDAALHLQSGQGLTIWGLQAVSYLIMTDRA